MSPFDEMVHRPEMAYGTVIRLLVEDQRSLTRQQAREVVGAVLDLRYNELETAAILVALARKGETADEIAGAVDAIRARHPPRPMGEARALNIGGTGGDRAGTFNISTTASFVVAAAGVPVVKHGNRSVTSACGSSDMMAALGVSVEGRSEIGRMRADLRACNFAFVATGAYYRFPAAVSDIRRRIGIRSIFNLAGPLAHPTVVPFQLVGVARRSLMTPMARALLRLGGVTAFVVHGVDGLDEVSCVGETLIAGVRQGEVHRFTVQPGDFDVRPCQLHELRGGDARRNAEICEEVLRGGSGPFRDATIVAAGTALVLAGRANSFAEAATACRQAIDTGRAYQVLKKFKEAKYENESEDLRHYPSR